MFVASRRRSAAASNLTRVALLVALVMQSGYLAMTDYRFHQSLQTFHPEDNAYASITNTLVGGHHVHVAVGVLMTLYVLLRLTTGLTN